MGGSPKREVYGAIYANQNPQMKIWVSSGSPREYTEEVFEKAGIQSDRYILDYRAVDTVTNFTTLVNDFQAQKITDIYVITDVFHMPRAQVIGSLVLGSRGINFHPVPIPPQLSYKEFAVVEAKNKTLRDGIRSVFWLFTGKTLNDQSQWPAPRWSD